MIKSAGWIIMALITFYFTNKEFILYLGIFPSLIFLINLWNLKSRKLLLEINNTKIDICTEEKHEIDSTDYDKVQFEFKNQDKYNELSCMIISIKKSKLLDLNISSEESYKLIWYVRNKLPMIRFIDNREVSISKKEKQLKDKVWESALGFIVFSIGLIVIIYKYDYWLEMDGLSTKSLVFEKAVEYIDMIGGKALMISIFSYILLLAGLNYFYYKDKVENLHTTINKRNAG